MKVILIILLLVSSCFAVEAPIIELGDIAPDIVNGDIQFDKYNIPEGMFDHFEYICPDLMKLTVEFYNDYNGDQHLIIDCKEK